MVLETRRKAHDGFKPTETLKKYNWKNCKNLKYLVKNTRSLKVLAIFLSLLI